MKMIAGVKAWALALCAVAVMVLTVGAAQATTFTWDFSTPTGQVTSPHTYLDTTNAIQIVASGWNTFNAAPTSGTWNLGTPTTETNLFGKFTSGDPGETGLGLFGKPASEIQTSTLIQLDLIDLLNHGLTSKTITIGSVQTGESWAIFDSDTSAGNGASGTFAGGGTGTSSTQMSITLPISSRYEWITATNKDVLLDNGFSATTAVPEPSTLLLLGFGLAGLAGIRRKFKK